MMVLIVLADDDASSAVVEKSSEILFRPVCFLLLKRVCMTSDLRAAFEQFSLSVPYNA